MTLKFNHQSKFIGMIMNSTCLKPQIIKVTLVEDGRISLNVCIILSMVLSRKIMNFGLATLVRYRLISVKRVLSFLFT